MAVKKQPESEATGIPEAADEWFRQFLKLLEITMFETGQDLTTDARTVKKTWPTSKSCVRLDLLQSSTDNIRSKLLSACLAQSGQTDHGGLNHWQLRRSRT